MTTLTVLVGLLALCSAISALFLGYRMYGHHVTRLISMSTEAGALENRMFPLAAFTALLAVLIKLTVF